MIFKPTKPDSNLALTPLEKIFYSKRGVIEDYFDLHDGDLDKMISVRSLIKQRVSDYSRQNPDCLVIQKQDGSEYRFINDAIFNDVGFDVNKFLHGILLLQNEALQHFSDWNLAQVYILSDHAQKFLNFLLSKPSRGTKTGSRMNPTDEPLFAECVQRIKAGEPVRAVKREIVERMAGHSLESKRKRLNRFLKNN